MFDFRVCQKADKEFYAKTEANVESFPKRVLGKHRSSSLWLLLTPFMLLDVPLLVGYRNRGLPLILQQFKAMVVKRLLHSIRNWLVLIVQLVVPVIVLILAMIVNKTLPGPVDMPALPLNGDTYGHTNVPMFTSIIDPSGTEGQFLAELTDAYKSQLSGHHIRTVPDGDMTEWVVNEIRKVGQSNFDLNNLFGATFAEARIELPDESLNR